MSYLEGVRIDYDTADIITRLTLIESLKGINKDIAALEKKNNMAGHSPHISYLKDHEKEDLKDDLKYRETVSNFETAYWEALLVIIRYYSTTEEDMLELFDKDNDYLREWTKDQKIAMVKEEKEDD